MRLIRVASKGVCADGGAIAELRRKRKEKPIFSALLSQKGELHLFGWRIPVSNVLHLRCRTGCPTCFL